MSTDLEQLFRGSTGAAPATRIDLDAVVRRGRSARRRHQVRAAATVGVTGAIVVGVGAVATTGHLATGPSAAAGGGPTATPVSVTVTASADSPSATPASATVTASSVVTPTPTPTASTGTASAMATPGPLDTATAPRPVASQAPAQLRAVTLPDPAPGFGGRRFPDAVELNTNLNLLPGQFWTATFGVGDPTGAAAQATIFVGDFPLPATTGTPTLGASPGPITDTPTVAGHQAYVTHDGTQTILYFRTARFTVQVCGWHASVAQLVTLAEALRGIE